MADDPQDPKKKGGKRIPPLRSRFQPGQSGNPGGKPKKVKNDLDAKIVARFESKIPNSDNTVLDVILNSVIKEAARGDVRAAKTVIDLYRDALRKCGQAKNDDEADIEAAKRILNLDPRLFAGLVEVEPEAKEDIADVIKDDDDEIE